MANTSTYLSLCHSAITKIRTHFGLVVLLIGFFAWSQNVCSQTFSTPGSFSVSVPNYSGPLDPGEKVSVAVTATIVGAGGGGGRGQGAGGGGGGQVLRINFVANEGDTFSGVIGSGGSGRSGTDGSGTAGTNTSFNGTTANGGSGGGGGINGAGGSSGSGFSGGGGISGASPARRAGGGGAGSSTSGIPGTISVGPPNGFGGNGGAGQFGYGGGGGGVATSPSSPIQGTGTAGGTDGSTGTAANANNGGGGGGGRTRGGNGGNGIVVVTFEYFIILPVEYLYFNSNYNRFDRTGELTWATAKEWENSHFDVERSVNGVNSWSAIGQVAGANYSDSPVEYTFRDNNLPASGGNIYYRLKQVDFGGKTGYSVIRAIQVEPVKGSGAWIAYPNPSAVGTEVRIDLLNTSGFQDESIILQIADTRGISYTYSIKDPKGVSEIVNSHLERSKQGIYIVQLFWGNQKEQIKLIKN